MQSRVSSLCGRYQTNFVKYHLRQIDSLNIPTKVWEGFGAVGVFVLGGVYVFKNLALPEIPDFIKNNQKPPEAAQPWYESHMTHDAVQDIHEKMENVR